MGDVAQAQGRGMCCVHVPAITDSSEGTPFLEPVFCESLEQSECLYPEHLLWPVPAGAAGTKAGSPQGGESVEDTTGRNRWLRCGYRAADGHTQDGSMEEGRLTSQGVRKTRDGFLKGGCPSRVLRE